MSVRRRFVLDASVAIAWVHPGQSSAGTDSLLASVEDGATPFVPALWPLEVANALLSLERRKKLTRADRERALELLRDLPIEVDLEMAHLAFGELSALAAALAVSVYDAAYLELALRLKAPLACSDGPLRQAAALQGLKILPDR